MGEPVATPTRVAGLQEWDAVVTGASFACALRSGAAWCWGRNDAGQLGDGTQEIRIVPTRVAGGHRFTRITAGLSHACGLRADSIALCWGANARGEVGDGTSEPRLVPVPVNTPPSVNP
jgi:alpha-tubulin suppressor-like RCC1 family protein